MLMLRIVNIRFKKILNLLGTITLIGTSTTSLVACNKTHEYTYEELIKLKEKNNINTKDDILEWIAPQEKPFNKVDNKWYFVIWKADKWIATKYKNNRYEPDTGWIIEDLPNVNCVDLFMIQPNATFGAYSDGRWRQWDREKRDMMVHILNQFIVEIMIVNQIKMLKIN